MKTFKQFLIEFDYGKHDELEADSRLLFMGVKKHLRDKKNWQVFHQIKRIRARDLPIHPDLKAKHKNLTLTFGGPDEKVIAPAYHKGQKKLFSKDKSISTIHMSGMNALHKDFSQLTDKHNSEVLRKHFLKQFHNNFSTFRHEYQHYRDLESHGFKKHASDITYNLNPKKPVNYYDYINTPAEHKAHKKQLDYELEKHMRTTPHHFVGSKTKTPSLVHPTSKKVVHTFKNNHHASLLASLSEKGVADHNWLAIYHFSNKKHKNSFHSIINKHYKKWVAPLEKSKK